MYFVFLNLKGVGLFEVSIQVPAFSNNQNQRKNKSNQLPPKPCKMCRQGHGRKSRGSSGGQVTF